MTYRCYSGRYDIKGCHIAHPQNIRKTGLNRASNNWIRGQTRAELTERGQNRREKYCNEQEGTKAAANVELHSDLFPK